MLLALVWIFVVTISEANWKILTIAAKTGIVILEAVIPVDSAP